MLTPGFLEAEAALALEAARLLGWEGFTLARGRTGLEGAAGSVWTPKYTFAARPQMDVLLIPGGSQMSKLGRDEQHQEWLGEIWEALRAVFCGANAPRFLLEAGYISGQVAAHPNAQEALSQTTLELTPQALHWQGKVCTTGGYLDLARALLDYAGFADEAKRHLGLL